jgi:glycosyltransferase 2 family protein
MGNSKSDKWKVVVKAAVGALLIFYVLRSKMVDFNALRDILRNPANFLVALGFLTFSALCCTFRWFLLVRAQGLELSYKNLFSLTMIGSFFNTFMPGSVGGDLIKAWYIAGQEPTRRTRAVLTVLLDRVIGLAVILFYSAVTLALYSQWLKDHLHLRVLAYGIWAYALCSIIFTLFFFNKRFWELSLAQRILKFASRVPKLEKLLHAGLVYRHHFRSFAGTLGLSALSVLGLNIFYAYQGSRIGIQMDLAQYFFAVPIAMVVSAIPILPGGIGTGQVAFYHLFAWMGVPNPDLGGTLCTLVQIYTIVFNCIGALFYLRFKKKPARESIQRQPISSESSLTPA